MQPQAARREALKARNAAEVANLESVKGAYKTFMRSSGGKYYTSFLESERERALAEAEKATDPYVAMKMLGVAKCCKASLDHINRLIG